MLIFPENIEFFIKLVRNLFGQKNRPGLFWHFPKSIQSVKIGLSIKALAFKARGFLCRDSTFLVERSDLFLFQMKVTERLWCCKMLLSNTSFLVCHVMFLCKESVLFGPWIDLFPYMDDTLCFDKLVQNGLFFSDLIVLKTS